MEILFIFNDKKMNSVYITKIQSEDNIQSITMLGENIFQTPVERVDFVLSKDKTYTSAFIHFKQNILPNDEMMVNKRTKIYKTKFHTYIFGPNITPILNYPQMNDAQIGNEFKKINDVIECLQNRIIELENKLNVIQTQQQRKELVILPNNIETIDELTFI